MTILDVKVKSIDHSAKYLYPNRTIEIKTSNQSIVTPIRAATFYEYREKAKVPTDIPLNNQISINIENLSHSRFEKFLTTNHYFGKLMKRIAFSNRLSQYSDLSLVLLRPTISPKRDKNTRKVIRNSPMEFLTQDSTLRDKFIRFLVKLQYDVGLNPISIPFLNLPFSTFQDVITQIDKSLEKIDRQPLFFVDMNYGDFESAIDLIVNKLESRMVGLYFKRFRNYPLSYEVLSRYVERDVAFVAVQVNRYDYNYDDISTMHYLPFFGNDVYAVKTPPPFGGSKIEEERKEPPSDRLAYVRLFDKESLRVRPVRVAATTIEKLAQEYRNDALIPTILNNYDEANTDDAKYKVLRAFSKVSELNSSLSEFTRFQDYVKEGSTREYIQEKQILQNTLQEVREHSAKHSPLKQTKLT